MQKSLKTAQQAADKAQAATGTQHKQMQQAQQERDKLDRALGLRDTALKALRQEVDDVLKEDAEKAQSLEEVIEEMERLQQAQADKAAQLKKLEQTAQVRKPCRFVMFLSSCRCECQYCCHIPAILFVLICACVLVQFFALSELNAFCLCSSPTSPYDSTEQLLQERRLLW